ncbi:WD40 repeat domain-containing protein [Ktedonospora formicarum]|uniref:Anaphase-promoting complex subunit 4-like WD40 domain-containing protein n=1 Tax=Ktedonospora formicarum TaxID=2778364 RepID=A0A8J3HUS1_9CHLR|nr:hypothetical protein [Ktedonospora formicarum]GHO42361.1 hypothetical protein KSX_05240 [Ktedonospora formicarum]
MNEYKEHQEAVTKLVWLDNETIISASGAASTIDKGQVSHTVRVWKAKDGTTIANYATPEGTVPFSWSPDGKRILSVERTIDANGIAELGLVNQEVWEASTGKVLAIHQGQFLMSNIDFAWSPDGKYIVTTSSMGGGAGAPPEDFRIDVWESASGQGVITNPAGERDGICVSWQPKGMWVVSGHVDGYARIWEALTGKQVQIFQPGNGSVLALDWSPDGKRIGASIGSFQALGYPTDISVWDIEQKKVLGIYEKHSNYVRSLKWSPDGMRMASTDSTTVHIWQAA